MSTVTQWYLFGIHLRVDLTTLSGIEADYQKAKERLTQTVIQWWKNVTPTWSAVIKALIGIGREKLASQLAEKHGMNLHLEFLAYQLPIVHYTQKWHPPLLLFTGVPLPDCVDITLLKTADAEQNEVR